MLRKFLLLLALLVLVGIGLVWANVIDLSYNREAEAPIELRVNPVEVGTTNTTVQTPALRVNDGSAPAAAPAPAPGPAAAPAPAPAPAPATNGQ